MIVKGRSIVKGIVSGKVLITKDPISFLGGVDPSTGEVIDPDNEAKGQNVAGKILVFPRGKGSTVGSYVMLQLKKNNVAPLGIINVEAETIVAVGAIISEIPFVDNLEQDPFKLLKNDQLITVNGNDGTIEY